MEKKFHIITFGCQMNEDDSQFIANTLYKAGFKYSENPQTSDIVIINSCAVRQHAEHRAISELGRFKKWKEKYPDRKLIFAGCVAEKNKKNLKKRFKYVDEIIGSKSLNQLPMIIHKYANSTTAKNNSNFDELKLFNSSITDYQTISRGCNLSCSYCIVPSVRGRSVYTPFKEIIDSIKLKISRGIKEIILLGQTVNSYTDKIEKINFDNLLLEISKFQEIKRIRFMSPHPLYFTNDFFKIYSENKKISRHIHLPVQSGSDDILKKMKRGYTISEFNEIISKLKQADENTFISTDFIVGYPGETEADFIKTVELAEKVKFCFAFCFKYSQRGKEFPHDTISETEKEKRLDILLKIVKKNSKLVLASRIGKLEELLIEKNNSGKALTGFNCSIINSERNFNAGDSVKIKIEKLEKNTLYGKVEND